MTDTVEFVDAATLHAWLESGEAVVVDVREDGEYVRAHIDGALLNPMSRFDPGAVAAAPGQKVVVHCQRGVSCEPTSARLIGAGHQNVYRLSGGLLAWVEAGLPVETGAA